METDTKATNQQSKKATHLRMISDASLHGPTCVIMLYSKSNVRNQTSIIFGDSALHLIINKTTRTWTMITTTTRTKTKIDPLAEKGPVRTLISLKGIRRLLSSLESSPRMRAALRKLRLVAARAFMTMILKLSKQVKRELKPLMGLLNKNIWMNEWISFCECECEWMKADVRRIGGII